MERAITCPGRITRGRPAALCRRRLVLVAALGVTAAAMAARAEKLDAGRWRVVDESSGGNVTVVTDNRLDTSWTASGTNGLLIDLVRTTVLHRLYITPGNGFTNNYRQLDVTFLAEPAGKGKPVTCRFTTPACDPWKVDALRQTLRAGGTDDLIPPDKPEADLRFNPRIARYVRIRGATPIAEVMAYGSDTRAAFEKDGAVVVASDAPAILRVAAEDLRYYIGELSGRPLPVIAPGQEAPYPGTLYRIADLAPLAPDVEQMAANSAAGRLPNALAQRPVTNHCWREVEGGSGGWYGLDFPDQVNVERQGREVLFKAWPHRNVAYSVWEFLRQQGVIWAAPEDHADYVPAGKGVDLSRLPLRTRPSAQWRQGGCEGEWFSHGPVYWNAFFTDDTLFPARNGATIGRVFPGLGTEVPPVPQSLPRPDKEFDAEHLPAGGFEGHPHNLHSVVPPAVLEAHPDWCGMTADGRRLPPGKGGPGTFCFTHPDLIRFVADKMIYCSGSREAADLLVRMVPSDGSTFCQCERCTALCQPFERPSMAYCAGDRVAAGPYYYFITEVAKRVKPRRPNLLIESLAYADYTPAPLRIARFPDNTTVQVCIYGQRNLPLTAPANAPTRAYLEAWATRGVPLSHWDYLLIHAEWRALPMPAPMVTAIVDREKYLARLGMLNGLTQADRGSLSHNPWNYYAYARMLWDASLTADTILDEFFTAYYQEARAPMLAYYKALEAHLIRNSVSLEDFGYDLGPNPGMFTPELAAELQGQIGKARAAASAWYVRARVERAAQDLEWAIPAALRRTMEKSVALQYGKKEYVCRRRTGAITVDGKLDDPGWEHVPTTGGFVQPKTCQPAPASEQTEFRVTWDDSALYIGVRCADTRTSIVKLAESFFDRDHIEVFIVPERNFTAAYYQAGVSAEARSWGPERFLGDMWHKDAEDLPAFEAATSRGNGEWTCECVIPFRRLKEGAPKPGDYWRFNIARGGSTWSRLPIANWHLYRDFDFITFAEAEPRP